MSSPAPRCQYLYAKTRDHPEHQLDGSVEMLDDWFDPPDLGEISMSDGAVRFAARGVDVALPARLASAAQRAASSRMRFRYSKDTA